MSVPHVHGGLTVVANERELWAALADIFVADARAAIARRGAFSVALSGGTTPKGAYELLAASPRRDQVAWERLSVFFSDERCVPPDDAQSNYGMANAALLAHVPVQPEHVHRMRGELPPEEAADAYASVLRDALGDEPVLDLLLLGMGPDGHTASLFPGTSPIGEQRLLVAAPFVPKFGAHRLTLTPYVINRARHVVIAAAGAEKSHALERALQGPYDPNSTPVQVVRPVSGALTWLVDRAAASQLSSRAT